MENQNYQYENVIQIEDAVASRKFMANVFLWMFAALGASAFFAYLFANDDNLLSLLYDFETGQRTGLGLLVTFAPLGFVFLMSLGFQRLSYSLLVILFVLYSVLTGISLSFILLYYSAASVSSCFLTASLLFGVMAVAGYTTKQDLTNFGSILLMLLVGLIIASVINWFMKSEQMDYIISFAGVAIFVGLTAYDVQKLKRIGAGEYSGDDLKKASILGALTLYLDFINLFLYLLRLFGRRK